LVIDDPQTEALAQELARRTGLTPEQAVARALAETLQAKTSLSPAQELKALRDEISRTGRSEDWPNDWEGLKTWAQGGRD
jgi:hypothetical protein